MRAAIRYVLTAGEQYRQACGFWAVEIKHAGRFLHNPAVVRRDELAMDGVVTRTVETSGQSRQNTEPLVKRIA